MESSAEEYSAFEQKVSRTVYFDNLSPQVTESVIRTALDQFATVKNVKFIPNYIGPSNLPQCALVELDSAKKVKEIVSMVGQYSFMMSGMPRPVRAQPAVMEMFDDRPIKPNRKIKVRWLKPSEPEFEVAKELKNLTRKHAAEIEFVRKLQLDEEEKLAKQQEETLKVHYKKFKMIDGIMADKTAHRLARRIKACCFLLLLMMKLSSYMLHNVSHGRGKGGWVMISVVSVGGGLFGKRIVGWREKRVCTIAVFVYGKTSRRFPIALTGRSARVPPQPLELALNQFLLHCVLELLCSLVVRRTSCTNPFQARQTGTRPNPFARKVAQATCLTFERANISPRQEGTHLSEIPRWLLVPPSSPRLGEGVPPERDPSA
ncbi:hypothetical protein DEO72_LG6g449 [Vigna unguiculata]|uniref:RRM domain-containing protein n=1 Tax=Vigna unguiculata TaxID=3917 RepID=A0A4D6M4Q4_VIGUN|nr:hypothetical protein DEO72_LG6g449 [Vigna unguiculata]